MLLCSFTKRKTGSVFPAFCHATFHHALISCCDVSRAEYNYCSNVSSVVDPAEGPQLRPEAPKNIFLRPGAPLSQGLGDWDPLI